MEKGHIVLAVVGLTGAGKTVVSEHIKSKGWHSVRFGQVVIDELTKQGLTPTENNERPIREGFRTQFGMAAMANLNLPKIEEGLKTGHVVCDGLYSWSEYKVLKEKFNVQYYTLAVVASPKTRYTRLVNRTLNPTDTKFVNRPATLEAAKNRDYAEIENVEKGGPIAMADFTIINEGSQEELLEAVDDILTQLP